MITAWTMCSRRFRLSIPANTLPLFREFINSRKLENLCEPFLNTWKHRMIFFKRVTCDSRFDYIRERMLNCVTNQAAESHPLKGLDQSVCNILLTFNNCIVLLYRQWVADGRKIPMEEMIDLSTMLLENGIKRIEISKGIIISVVCTLIF